MKYFNPAAKRVEHTFRGYAIEVEPGDVVDIRPEWVPFLVSRGSVLRPYKAPAPPPEPAKPKADKPGKPEKPAPAKPAPEQKPADPPPPPATDAAPPPAVQPESSKPASV